jgi:hypothetical protein
MKQMRFSPQVIQNMPPLLFFRREAIHPRCRAGRGGESKADTCNLLRILTIDRLAAFFYFAL